MQVLNDGADEEDFKQLLEILKGFGEVEVLYDPNDPKDKDVTGDEVIERYERFKKKARKNGSSTEGRVSDTSERAGKRRRKGKMKCMENDRFILNRNSDVKVIYIGTGQFQLASGKWVDAILYKYRGVYKMMEASEFIRLAEQDKSTTLDRIGDIIGSGYAPDIEPDKEEHNLSETEKYFQRWTKRNNNGKDEVRV